MLVYSIHGESLSQYSLARSGETIAISEAIVYGSGLVALTRSLRFIWVRDHYKPRPVVLPAIPTMVRLILAPPLH